MIALSFSANGATKGSLGQRPRNLARPISPALKGRPKPCPNPSPASIFTWSSALKIANRSSPMPSAIPCTPTWQASCKTSAASPSSSIPSRITFISFSIWGAPLPSVRQWRMLKSRRPNGSSPVGRSLPGLHGNRDTVPLPFPNQNPKPSGNTSPTNGSTIGEKHFRKNTASFLNAIASCSMNGMCGIDRNLGPPLQGLFDGGL